MKRTPRSFSNSHRQILAMSAIYLGLCAPTANAVPPEIEQPCQPGALKRLLLALKGEKAAVVKEAAQAAPEPHPRKIESLDDLLMAFTEGFQPDLTKKDQRNAFEIYRKMRFGNPNTSLESGAVQQIADAIKKHPELNKQPFRSFTVSSQEKTYPVTQALAQFVDSQAQSAGKVRGDLFQVGQNRSFWKKVFQYEEPVFAEALNADPAPPPAQAKEAKKAAKAQLGAHFEQFLNERISEETRKLLADVKQPAKVRAQKLYAILTQERKNLQAQGKDVRPISQAIVDLVHTIGYHDGATAKNLRSGDGMVKLGAYRKILEERDTFSMELGYTNHFQEVLADLGVEQPTGMASSKGLSQKLQSLEDEVVQGAQIVTSSGATRTIRPLSLEESPFRSCLGGSDCSSRTYLTRALDPNYIYFTLTDEQGFSSGHITVVLGEAKSSTGKVKTAFIDKVQNVDNIDMPIMMEGVRRSLEEKGYALTVPVDVGDHNGISNESVTRGFIERSIPVDKEQKWTGFKPDKNDYKFPEGYSRAELKLAVRPVLPLKPAEGVSLTPAGFTPPWKSAEFDLKKLVKASIDLKHGNDDAKIRYISSMKTLKAAGLDGDPAYDATLAQWLGDSSLSFKLRKQVAITEWAENKKVLGELLDRFSSDEQSTLVQNVLDTPRYRKILSSNKKELPALIARVRTSPKVAEMLAQEYSPTHSAIVMKIAGASDVPVARAVDAIKSIEKSFSSSQISEVIALNRALSGTSLEAWARESTLDGYLSRVKSNAALGRGLAGSIDSADAGVKRFGEELLAKANGKDAAKSPILKAYRDILARRTESTSFTQATESWVRDPHTDAALKAEFILTQIGAGEGKFEKLLEKLPEPQKKQVWTHIDETTSLGAFRKLAQEKKALGELYNQAALESFQVSRQSKGKFKTGSPATEVNRGGNEAPREIELKHKIEVSATAETQLKWYLTMGKNPSKFKEAKHADGDLVQIAGTALLANHPVESVSWWSAVVYANKRSEAAGLKPTYILDGIKFEGNAADGTLNAIGGAEKLKINAPGGDIYKAEGYRLPTEAEREVFSRAGSSETYSFGDDGSRLDDFGWYSQNSESRSHAVAMKSPNANGLYDVHGNVWEWTGDWYTDAPSGGVNPAGPPAGSHRVIRGGSWNINASHLRSAQRNDGSPGNRYAALGFRLVRTLE